MKRATGSLTLFVASMPLWLCTSCGTGVTDALLLAGESGARTFVDVLVSDLLSDLPNRFTFPTSDDAPDGGPEDDPDDGDDTDDDPTGGTDGLVGVVVDGEATFTINGCVACHCAVGATCAEGLVNLEGIGTARLEEKLLGEGFHAGGKFPDLTAQDIADLEVFLAG